MDEFERNLRCVCKKSPPAPNLDWAPKSFFAQLNRGNSMNNLHQQSKHNIIKIFIIVRFFSQAGLIRGIELGLRESKVVM